MPALRQVHLYSVFALVATVVILLLVAGDDVTIPHSMTTEGRIVSGKEWMLVKRDDGTLTSISRDHLTGVAHSFDVSQFERGDAVRFSLSPGVAGRRQINQGDTIGSISSNETLRRLSQLRGEYQTASASLHASLAGEKTSIVREAEQRLIYAREQVARQRRLVDRLTPQHQNGFISEEEYDQARSALDLYELNVSIAEAQLETARTGDRPEQIVYIQSRIRALEEEIAMLEDRLDRLTLVSPISGELRRTMSADTLLRIVDPSVHVVFIPVRWQDRDLIQEGQTVRVHLPGSRNRLEAVITEIDPTAHLISGQPVIVATALLEASDTRGLSGLVVRCTINGEALSVSHHLRRFLASFLS